MDAENTIWIPGGWVAHGALPPFDPCEKLVWAPHELACLTEDVWQARSPGEMLIVDLGWYPHGNPFGQFRAVVVLGKNWMRPLESIMTPSLEKSVAWIQGFLRPFLRRGGEMLLGDSNNGLRSR